MDFNCTVQWCRNHDFTFYTLTLDNFPVLQSDQGELCVCGFQYKGNADIAGPGVIIAFIVSAGLCCFFVMLYGLLSTRKGSGRPDTPREPLTVDNVKKEARLANSTDGDDSGQEGSIVVDCSGPHSVRCHGSDPAMCVCRPNSSSTSPPTLVHKTFNPIDRWSRRVITPRCRKAVSWIGLDPDALCAALTAGVVGLSDQLGVTSIAIIIAAGIQILNNKEPLSVNHLSIVSDIVCLGLSASIFATTLIRGGHSGKYEQSTESTGRKRRRRFILCIRILLVIASSVSLCVSMWWTSIDWVDSQSECAAVCVIRSQDRKRVNQGPVRIIFIVCLLLYFISFFGASLTVRRLWVRYVSLRVYPQKDRPPAPLFGRPAQSSNLPAPTAATQSKEQPKKGTVVRTILRHMRLGITMPLWIVWVVIVSGLLAQSVYVWIVFAVNIVVLRKHRKWGQLWMFEGDDSENEWGFGQLVAVFVLVIPFLSMWDAYSDFANAREEENERAGLGDGLAFLEKPHPDKVET